MHLFYIFQIIFSLVLVIRYCQFLYGKYGTLMPSLKIKGYHHGEELLEFAFEGKTNMLVVALFLCSTIAVMFFLD